MVAVAAAVVALKGATGRELWLWVLGMARGEGRGWAAGYCTTRRSSPPHSHRSRTAGMPQNGTLRSSVCGRRCFGAWR